MFWDDAIFRKEGSNKSEKVRYFSGIDTIRAKKKTIDPSKIQKPVQRSKKAVFTLTKFLVIFLILELAFVGFFGVKTVKSKTDVYKFFRSGKYLVLFQNNSEMRPSGGFIGSYAVVTLNNFKLQKIDFNANIYQLDQKFAVNNKITPPAPLQSITDNWALRDSNFAVSFPSAAQKVEWFYTQESGENIDGVIALNASVIRDILNLTGPIQLKNEDTVVNSEDFFTILTTKIEQDYYTNPENWAKNEPKTILTDLMNQLFEKTFSVNKVELAKFFYRQITEKQILLYANNSEIEKAVLDKNWGGEVQNFLGDYLQVNNANIGGMKSSLNVKESINYSVTQKDGSVVGNLNLVRSHTGAGVWPDGINNNWTRILVPKGSVLEKAELNGTNILKKVIIEEEAGKTSFGVWINTAPGTSNVLDLSYDLPISANNYQLLVQKQSGNLGNALKVSFSNKVLFDGVLNEDKVIGK